MTDKPAVPQELKDTTVEDILTGKADKAFGKSNSLVSAAQVKRSILALQAATKHNLTIALDSQWRDTMREVEQLCATLDRADSAQRDRVAQLAAELQASRAEEALLSYRITQARSDIIALEMHILAMERRRLVSRIKRAWYRFDEWMTKQWDKVLDSMEAAYEDELVPLREFGDECAPGTMMHAPQHEAFVQASKAAEEFGDAMRALGHAARKTHSGSSVGE